MADIDLPSFHGLIGLSPAMLALFRRIERVARFDVPVLIRGETGTGKELVARAIPQLSRRSGRRFETVNCGALTRELLLSELFGHERGAFTGAVTTKVGLLGGRRRHCAPRRGRRATARRPGDAPTVPAAWRDQARRFHADDAGRRQADRGDPPRP